MKSKKPPLFPCIVILIISLTIVIVIAMIFSNRFFKEPIARPPLVSTPAPTVEKIIPSTPTAENKAPIIPGPFATDLIIQERKVVGNDTEKLKTEKISKLKFINEINSNWRELLEKNILSFGPHETQLTIQPVESLIEVRGLKGRYIELVKISSLTPHGHYSSFTAHIDSGSGAIIRTWNKFTDRRQHQSLGISPSGKL